ncbi:hypothetical protein OJAV_G00187800 [Oryzias javanicus]|uniref:Uncharacterized protein n=1 Tax=Oryzias javanicus TaxID=123683 RepID=A0A3S2PER9_ORYJA|nr:hypothetical protein OJAV_G00187800 [Oryzias javanicus]
MPKLRVGVFLRTRRALALAFAGLDLGDRLWITRSRALVDGLQGGLRRGGQGLRLGVRLRPRSLLSLTDGFPRYPGDGGCCDRLRSEARRWSLGPVRETRRTYGLILVERLSDGELPLLWSSAGWSVDAHRSGEDGRVFSVVLSFNFPQEFWTQNGRLRRIPVLYWDPEFC